MNQQAITQDFVESQTHIETVARRFATRYRYDLDELISIANEVFMDIHSGLPTNRNWLPYLHGCLWNCWIDALRKKTAKCRATLPEAAMGGMAAPVPPKPLELEQLSDDGWLVACFTIDPTPEVANEAAARGGTPTNLRSCIRKHFAELGWDATRISLAFEEIGDYLASR